MSDNERETPTEVPKPPRRPTSLPPEHRFIREVTRTIVEVSVIAAMVVLVLYGQLDVTTAAVVIAVQGGAWAAERLRKNKNGPQAGLVSLVGSTVWEIVKRSKGLGMIPLLVFVGCGTLDDYQSTMTKILEVLHTGCKVVRHLPEPHSTTDESLTPEGATNGED